MTLRLDREELRAARAHAQYLTAARRGVNDADYLEVLRALGPMRPPAHAFPGTPVLLHDRHEGDPVGTAERVRRERRVLKGRFQHGHVAYVAAEDLALYAAAFARPIPGDLAGPAAAVVETLEREGPMHRADLAPASGVRGKELVAVLQALQLAFVAFEDQTETEWDNPWALIEGEHPGLLDGLPERFDARVRVLERFARAFVLCTPAEASAWSGFPRREAAGLLEESVAAGRLQRACLEDERGYYAPADYQPVPAEACLAVPDIADPLVTPQAADLKKRFPGPNLRFVCLDGEIVGAVEGRWGIKPYDVTDVRVPPELLSGPLREELLASLREHYPPPAQRVLRYGGLPLDGAGNGNEAVTARQQDLAITRG
ncbi:MAG TPA: crosslink repair DNA glycosylase YcaQ family protein [Deinococcales bacterium]|nr:crosslink repair DNA glycosylase YcaQ family protein [Deinococcales bacterium]